MKQSNGLSAAAILLAGTALLVGNAAGNADAEAPVSVSGTAVHYFSTSIIHSRQPTATGSVQRSTEIIELSGDLRGYVLYHPTSVFDTTNATLVNTGRQVFSGTVKGSAPVILYDDEFRFDIDLATGETIGRVLLRRRVKADAEEPWAECELRIVGTGRTAAGDVLADYTGTCIPREVEDRSPRTP